MAFPLHGRVMFGEGQEVIVIILLAAVLGLFVISLTSSFLGNRRQRS